MTQEDKQLLLIDLCARLPYTPQIVYNGSNETLSTLPIFDMTHIKEEYLDIKPYLRPMSSMTEEEHCEYNSFSLGEDWISNPYMSVPSFHVMDWINSHHFDYRGLIEKGLALEAPEGMYKTE